MQSAFFDCVFVYKKNPGTVLEHDTGIYRRC